jgi:hypothetical protein
METTWPRTVRGLFYAAMAVFLVTIVIGIINGLDLYEFDRGALLTHVHTGTLGWVTLTLVAMTAWYSRGIDRRLAWALALIIPVYALAFMVAPSIRSVLGGVLFIAILALVAWAWGRYNANRTITSLAMALGFTTFTYGAIIGVLIQVQLAGIATIFPSGADTVGAHASAMVFSYLVLVAMGILEWRVLGGAGRSRAGLVQLALLFISGALLSFTLLFMPPDAVQPVGGLVLLLNLVSVGIFAARVLPTALRTDWMGGPGRHLAAAALFVVVAMVIFLYVIYRFITDPTLANDPTAIAGVLVASDHSAFIGVITNLVFAALITLSADRRSTWPWADQVAFWGTNIGLVVFLVGLVAGVTILKQIGAPLMGVALLVGLAAFAIRLRDSSLAATEA